MLHEGDDTIDDEDESEAASWLMFDGPPPKNASNQNGKENGFLFNGEGGEDDQYLDFMEFGGDDQQQCFNKVSEKIYGGGDTDSVVPVQKNHHHQIHQHDFQNQKFQMGIEYETSNGYGYHPLTQSVSFIFIVFLDEFVYYILIIIVI